MYLLILFMQDGVDSLKDLLEIQPENSDALKAIANAFKYEIELFYRLSL